MFVDLGTMSLVYGLFQDARQLFDLVKILPADITNQFVLADISILSFRMQQFV